jgi:hypothetical protein
MKALIAGIGLLALAGCAIPVAPDENSPYYLVPVGSTLKLNQPVDIHAHRARAYIQGGRVLSFPEVKLYYPHCTLEIRTLKDTVQTVQPGTFTIRKVVQNLNDGVSSGQRQLAHGGIRLVSGSDGGLPILMYATHLYLYSGEQPDVLRLTCQQMNETNSRAVHVTIREMRTTLGSLINLTLATPPGSQ